MSSNEYEVPAVGLEEVDEDQVAEDYVQKMGDLEEEIEQIDQSERTTKEMPAELDSEDFTLVPREDQEYAVDS
jgi:hypothetical protein